LKKIVIVDTNSEVSEAFQKNFSAAAAAAAAAAANTATSGAAADPAVPSPPVVGSGSSQYSFKTDVGLAVEVYQGDLVKEHSDVVVCSVTNRISIAAGAAKFVSNAAGDVLKKEHEKLVNEKKILRVGEVVCLPGGKLQAKNVLFVCHDANGTDVEARTSFVNCLDYANDHLHASTIAIPALGAGNYKFDACCLSSRVKQDYRYRREYFS
jgi:O-acetyl-ADP-ribose deacetylase (regulator of RNase III)